MDGKIQSSKSEVQFWEGQANRAGEESTIKEEGLFCVEWCPVSEYL